MISYFAHEGTEHASESESLAHILKQDGLKIMLVTAGAVALAYGVLKLVSPKPKPTKQATKQQRKQGENENE